MRTAENHTSLWRRFEAVCLHPRLFEEQLILARARLMLYTAFASGLVAVPVIIYSFAKRPEMSDANVVLSVGHVMYASTFVLLRFFPTLMVPVTVMVVVSLLQLINSAFWSGGLDSMVLYAYPVAPVFFGLLGRAVHGVMGALTLCLGLLLFYGLEQQGYPFPAMVENREVQLVSILWLVGLAVGISVVSTRLFDQVMGQLKRELKQRSLADEDALAAQKAKDWFIAYFSHEIRTPISVIAGSIDLMEHNADPASQARQFKALRSASRGMVRLMDDLIDMSALETGRLSLLVEPMDLRLLIEDIGREFAIVAQQKGLTIEHEYQEGPIWVQGDVQRLRQILSNLVENGLKFTVAGGVALSVEPLRGAMRVCVSDTGPGIPESDRRFIFEPYARATDLNVRGSGLGLTISRSLLQQMGAELHLDSVVGEGSSFWFDLPVPPKS